MLSIWVIFVAISTRTRGNCKYLRISSRMLYTRLVFKSASSMGMTKKLSDFLVINVKYFASNLYNTTRVFMPAPVSEIYASSSSASKGTALRLSSFSRSAKWKQVKNKSCRLATSSSCEYGCALL